MGAGLLAGRYRLSHVIGRGGFGEVWEAHDTLANRAVAVKRFDTARDGLTERRRVRREIAVLRALRLPGVVALYDEGEDGGRPFLVMERVEGRDFPGRATPCPWSSLEALARALVGTLAGVHAVGVLHRDLKPSNVLVSESGGVTVLDFGIARFTASGARTLSADGALVGTPDYLAPEQLAGGDASERSDLYALGVMLYEALTGARRRGALREAHGVARPRARALPRGACARRRRDRPAPRARPRRATVVRGRSARGASRRAPPRARRATVAR
jgi:serine/threonine protein kinase